MKKELGILLVLSCLVAGPLLASPATEGLARQMSALRTMMESLSAGLRNELNGLTQEVEILKNRSDRIDVCQTRSEPSIYAPNADGVDSHGCLELQLAAGDTTSTNMADACIAAGGDVYALSLHQRENGVNEICRMSGTRCPAGWSQFRNWSAARDRNCSTNNYCRNNNCQARGHSFSDSTRRSCTYEQGSAHSSRCSTQTCRSDIYEVGCTLDPAS